MECLSGEPHADGRQLDQALFSSYSPAVGVFLPRVLPAAEAVAIVRTKLEWILDACAPVEVWLFGSAARDEMTEASDVDLALVFENEDAVSSARHALYSRRRLYPEAG